MSITGKKKTINKNETDYRAFFEFASEGIFIADSDGHYTDVNEIGLKMLGYTRKELLQLNLKDLIPTKELEFNIKKFKQIHDGKIVLGEQHLICKNGSLLPVEISATVLPNGSLLGMVRDITERKRFDAEIKRLNRVYEVISQINQMVVRTNKREILFSEACRIAIDYGKFRMAWFGLVEEKNNTIKPIVWAGVEEGYLKEVKIITASNVAEGRGPTGTAIREGKYVVSNDIANDSFMLPWRDESLKRGYHSSISLPIIIQGKTFGAFNIYASESHFFNEKEIQSLVEVTNNIAFALEKIEEENNRKAAEEKVIESLNSFMGLFNSVSEAIYIQDKDGLFINVNEGVIKMYGYTHEELIGKTPEFLSAPEKNDLKKVVELVKKVFDSGYPEQFEFWGKRKNGEIFPKEVICNKGKYFGKDVIIATARDITESKLAKEELKESEERFKSIIELAADGILLGSLTGIIIGVNYQICRITGYSERELMGENISFLFSEEELKKSPFRYDLLDLGIIVRNERFITRKDGTLIPIEMNTKEMPDHTYQTIIRDHTERLKSEELNRKIEKTEYENKVKSKFMANLSHEIRNPLNAIIGLNTTLLRSSLNSEQKVFAEAIDLSASNLLNILNDILDFSKIEANKSGLNFENFELKKLIENIILLNKQKSLDKGIEIHHSISIDIPEFVFSD